MTEPTLDDLIKRFNPHEPRDWRGRWTRVGFSRNPFEGGGGGKKHMPKDWITGQLPEEEKEVFSGQRYRGGGKNKPGKVRMRGAKPSGNANPDKVRGTGGQGGRMGSAIGPDIPKEDFQVKEKRPGLSVPSDPSGYPYGHTFDIQEKNGAVKRYKVVEITRNGRVVQVQTGSYDFRGGKKSFRARQTRTVPMKLESLAFLSSKGEIQKKADSDGIVWTEVEGTREEFIKRWNPSQPRWPSGSSKGGEWRGTGAALEQIKELLKPVGQMGLVQAPAQHTTRTPRRPKPEFKLPDFVKPNSLTAKYSFGRYTSKDLTGGAMAVEVRHLRFEDGTQAVMKQTTTKAEAAAEVIGSRLAEALGLRSTHVERLAPDRLIMDYVVDTREKDQWGSPRKYTYIFDENKDDTYKIGVLDTLVQHQDRHALNWLYDGDGRIVPIDNAVSTMNWTGNSKDGKEFYMAPRSPFALRANLYRVPTPPENQFVIKEYLPNKLTKADVAKLRATVESLKSEFMELEPSDDDYKKALIANKYVEPDKMQLVPGSYDAVLDRLRQMELMAYGKKDLLP